MKHNIKIKKKQIKHLITVSLLSFLIIGNIFSINGVLAVSSLSINSCLEICDPGPCTEPCVPVVCGDNIEAGSEECDDGNTENGDGCDSECILEYCGDLIINNTDEICDGNNQACVSEGYDGSQLCNLSCDGWNECVLSESCGDGILNGAEVCDDNNNEDCDGCRSDCTRLDDSCGDGYLECDEECDGVLGIISGYSCSSGCKLVKHNASGIIFTVETEDEDESSHEIMEDEIKDIPYVEIIEDVEDRQSEDGFIQKNISLIDINVDDRKVVQNNIVLISNTLIFNNKRPVFSGRVSLAYAYLYFQIHSEPVISGITRADKDGYWTWSAPIDLSLGDHKFYITVNDENNEASNVFYVIDFLVEDDLENVNLEQTNLINKSTKPLMEEISFLDTQAIEDSLKVYSFLNIDNTNDVSPSSILAYDFKIKVNHEEEIKTDLTFRVKNKAGKSFIEKTYPANFNKNDFKEDYFVIPRNMPLGKYYLESSLNIDNNYIFNQLEFSVLEKEDKSYWGILNVNLHKKDLMLSLLLISLSTFFILLAFELRALLKLAHIKEVEDEDLNNQII